MLSWKPPAQLGKGVKFSTWDHSTLPPKYSHAMCIHMALEVFANTCKISEMSSTIENEPFWTKVQSFFADTDLWLRRQKVCEQGVHICSQLVLGWHLRVLKPSPLFIPCFHFHKAGSTTDMPDKGKLHFFERWRRKKKFKKLKNQRSNIIHYWNSVWTAGGGKQKMEELK